MKTLNVKTAIYVLDVKICFSNLELFLDLHQTENLRNTSEVQGILLEFQRIIIFLEK